MGESHLHGRLLEFHAVLRAERRIGDRASVKQPQPDRAVVACKDRQNCSQNHLLCVLRAIHAHVNVGCIGEIAAERTGVRVLLLYPDGGHRAGALLGGFFLEERHGQRAFRRPCAHTHI